MFFISKHITNASHSIPAVDKEEEKKKKHCKLGIELFLN